MEIQRRIDAMKQRYDNNPRQRRYPNSANSISGELAGEKNGNFVFCCFTKTALFCLTFSWFYFPETFVAEEKKSFFNFFLSDK